MLDLNLVNSFKSKEKQITDLVNAQIVNYEHSKCYKLLQARYRRLDDSNNMKFGTPNTRNNRFKSSVAFPIVKPITLTREAIFSQNFRGDPLFSLFPIGNTTPENAAIMQEVLNLNLKGAAFRDKGFRKIKYSAARYGTAVTYSSWAETQKTAMRTVNDNGVILRKNTIIDDRQNAINNSVNLRDYIQDPNVSDSEESNYQGHRLRMPQNKLKSIILNNSDAFLKENVKEVFRALKNSNLTDKRGYDQAEYDAGVNMVDIVVFYSTLNIKGNEGNLNNYYLWYVPFTKKIIRFQENPHDDDIRPYSIINYYPKEQYWWGNSDSEFHLPHESYLQILNSYRADEALRLFNQYIFYEKGSLDVAELMARTTPGGYVGVDVKPGKNINNMVSQWQPQDQTTNSALAMQNSILENSQTLKPSADFVRNQQSTLLKNTTATAAQAIIGQGDIIESHLLEVFASGLKRMAWVNVKMLQQKLGIQFPAKIDPRGPEVMVWKEQILGDFQYSIKTSFTRNKLLESERLLQVLTQIMNFRGTQDPSWMNVDMRPVIKNWMKNIDIGDVDEIYPEQQGQLAGQQQQQLPAPQPQGGEVV